MQAPPIQVESTIDLEAMVREENWRAVLVDLIVSNKFDPWNIDVERLADTFTRKLEELSEHGFDVPSNLVLACAIVLKFKSLSLKFQEEEELPTIEDEPVIEDDSVPRLQPRMPITLHEIVKSVEKTLKRINAPVRERKAKETFEAVEIEVEEEDIEKEVQTIYLELLQLFKQKRATFFSSLMKEDREVAKTLLSLLFLTNEGKVSLNQEELFGDIEVKLLAQENN